MTAAHSQPRTSRAASPAPRKADGSSGSSGSGSDAEPPAAAPLPTSKGELTKAEAADGVKAGAPASARSKPAAAEAAAQCTPSKLPSSPPVGRRLVAAALAALVVLVTSFGVAFFGGEASLRAAVAKRLVPRVPDAVTSCITLAALVGSSIAAVLGRSLLEKKGKRMAGGTGEEEQREAKPKHA